jgi:hypothetical protein
MRDDETSQSPDYEVGYGKPPKSGQFFKGGKPGNPLGRPKRNFWPKLAEALSADAGHDVTGGQ